MLSRPDDGDWIGLAGSFPGQRAEQECWCWVAIAASLRAYVYGQPIPQCEIVGLVLGAPSVCQDPAQYNDRGALEDALGAVGFAPIVRSEDPHAHPLIEDLAEYIQANNRPVCMRIQFGPGDLAHVVAILWCDLVTRQVAVYDPARDGVQVRKYDYFPANYPVSGDWTHTYFPG